MLAPTLTTARLILRANTMADFDAMVPVMASDHVRYMGGPMDREAAWKTFCSEIVQCSLRGHGAWAIEVRETGAFLGQISIIKPPHFPETEIGWVILPDAQGKGYVSEAARAALDFAFGTLGLKTLVSYIERENTRSIALAERLGAVPDPSATPAYPEDDDIIYRHSTAGAIS
ncbi:MAG: GNAT family N-acetyltransferase [Paracoccaceae bacterium]